MAFGGLRGTLTGLGTSIVTPETADGSVAVSLQDLIVVMVAEAAANTVTTVTDNLGQTYTAINAGTLSSVGLRGYYRYVTVAGTLTQVSCAMTSSSNDHAISVAVYEGPFTSTPLDRAPTNTTDAATPYTCAATTVLSQANELIVAGLGLIRCQTATATSPNTLAINTLSAAANTNNACSSTIGYQVVAATTSITPVFASSGTITGGVQIVATFRQGVFDSAKGTASTTSTASGTSRYDISRAGTAAAVTTGTTGVSRSDVARAGSASAVSTATGASPAAGAATDYILRWNLASGTGTDLSGHSNDGVFNGGITPITGGPIGNAATFDGSSGYVQNDQIINQPYVSISLWIRTTASGYYHICGFSDTSGQHDKEINLNPGGTIVWYTTSAGYLYSASAVNGGAWHHIVCTIDATASCIYIDGVLDATSAGGASYASYITPTPHLGYVAAGGYGWLAATYDDFRVYDRALTASEATALFDEGDPFYELPRYLVSGYTPASDRSNYTGQTGVKFRARFALSYNRLGVRKGTGSTGYHTVNLYTFPGNVVALGTPLRTAEVDLTGGTVGNFYYADIAEITLTPDVEYFLVAETTASDGQSWSDGGAVTLLGVTPGFTYYAFAAPDNLAQTRVDLPNQMAQGVDLALFEEVATTDTGTGTATATSTASATGSYDVARQAISTATSTVNATGRSDSPRTVSSTATSTVTATGSSDARANASTAAATSTVTATGSSDAPRTVSSTATSTVTGTSRIDVARAGSAAATGLATGYSSSGLDVSGAGTAAATSTVTATGRSDAPRTVSSTATSTVTATGSSDIPRTGSSAATSTVNATSRYDISRTGASTATSVASAQSTSSKNLTTTRYIDPDVFGNPIVEVVGGLVQYVTPNRYADPDTFKAHTLSVGPVTLVQTRYVDPDTFKAHKLSLILNQTRYVDPDSFKSHQLNLTIHQVTKFNDPDIYKSHKITLTISQTRYIDPDTFKSHTISQGTVTLTTTRFVDPDSFKAHTITGATNLHTTRYIDPDTFKSHSLRAYNVLVETKYVDPDIFYTAHIITSDTQSIHPARFINTPDFGDPLIGWSGPFSILGRQYAVHMGA